MPRPPTPAPRRDRPGRKRPRLPQPGDEQPRLLHQVVQCEHPVAGPEAGPRPDRQLHRPGAALQLERQAAVGEPQARDREPGRGLPRSAAASPAARPPPAPASHHPEELLRRDQPGPRPRRAGHRRRGRTPRAAPGRHRRAHRGARRDRRDEARCAGLKHLLRNAAERTTEATWRRIGALLDRFSPSECANYFRNAGYASEMSHRALGDKELKVAQVCAAAIEPPNRYARRRLLPPLTA